VNRAIEWFARNTVAANLLMVVILIAGGFATVNVKQEVFPEFSLDLITVTVEYLGAAPEEVEEAVCVRIEEAIQGIDGVKHITSSAEENFGTVVVELELGADSARVLDDVKSRVDAIDTFPAETEAPVVREITNRRQVVNVAIWGDTDRRSLKVLAERVRDDLTAIDGITVVELANAPPYEISIEVSEDALRRHGLTFDRVADAVRRSSLDLPGGSVKTEGGEILLRTVGQAELGPEFERLPLLTAPDGSRVLVGDVARVVDGFADTDQDNRFDGKPAMQLEVFRVGDQSALDIVSKVEAYVQEHQGAMPDGVTMSTWQDQAKVLRDRRDLLLRNGAQGLVLVFISLALFLRFRLAFWVSLGIPISFLGAAWLMPMMDVSVNLISLFAFIVVLGIVVDDAIVAGENMYAHQSRHGDGLRGAIEGAREIGVPVVFAVLTTIAAFYPMLNVPGTIGKVMRTIPLIVIACLLFSLIESLLILPAHLRHLKQEDATRRRRGPWHRFQGRFADGLQWFIRRAYRPSLDFALRWRYLTVAAGIATLALTASLWFGGWVKWTFFPDVEADVASVTLALPQGTPIETTAEALARIERGAEQARQEILEAYGEDPFVHVVASIGSQPFRATQRQNAGALVGAESATHLGEVLIEMTPGEDRRVSGDEVLRRWREATGPIPDATELSFSSSLFSAGEDVNVQLDGPDLDELVAVADKIKARLAEYPNAYEIADSFEPGKRQIELDIKPRAELLGLTLSDLARQVRQAFYGEEAQRIVRGREDIRVMVRFPERDRRSLEALETLRVRTPDGAEVPFSEVADVTLGRGFATIQRVDRQRVVNVTAAVDEERGATSSEILAQLESTVLPEVLADHPRVRFSFEGQSSEQRETMGGLVAGFAMAMVFIYALLAIPLRSYAQPLIIMTAIPFGLVGAIWGHVVMGLNLTIMSMFGVVALAGVVVNDSLVMVDFINRYRERSDSIVEAVRGAGTQRFRPILLTSLTTFLGLTPLMLEQSMQARFLIPMAVALAFGVVVSTVISLMIVPCSYLIMTDVKRLARGLSRKTIGVGKAREEEQPIHPDDADTEAGGGLPDGRPRSEPAT
jgi:multidrug efflux pump subunit AcrB